MATVRFNIARAVQTVEDAAEKGLASATFLLAQKQKTSMTRRGKFISSAPGFAPNVQNTGLQNSIKSDQTGRMRWGAGSTFRGKSNYGLFLEKGAVIRPKRTKFLPVPINPAAKRLLEQRGKAGLRGSGQKFKVVRLPSGSTLLIGDTHVDAGKVKGKRGSRKTVDIGGEPVFRLARHVVIKPRPWCVVAYRKNKREIKADFDATVAKFLRQKWGVKK